VLPQLSNNYHTHPELHSHGSQQQVPGSSFRFPEDIQLFSQEGMRGGGPVPLPEYQEGGPVPSSINDQVAALAAKMGISPVEARGMILRGMVEKRGGTLSDDIINQFAQGLITLQEALAQVIGPEYAPTSQAIPISAYDREEGTMATINPALFEGAVPKMQTGGIVPLDLFEEGDQDINQALNMMSGAVNPPGAVVEETETISIKEEPSPMEEASDFQSEMMMLKSAFLDDIRFYVSSSGTKDLGEYLKKMNIAYASELKLLKEKHGVEESRPEEQLLTDEFLQEIMAMTNPDSVSEIPGFEYGGLVTITDPELQLIGWSREKWDELTPEQKKILKSQLLLQSIRNSQKAPEVSTERLDNLLKRREKLAKEIGEAASGSYSSYLPRALHYGAAKRAGKLAEAKAMDKVLADQIATERALLSSGSSRAGQALDFTADFRNRFAGLSGDDEFVDPIKMWTAREKVNAGRFDENLIKYPMYQSVYDMVTAELVPPLPAYSGKKKTKQLLENGKEVEVTVDFVKFFNIKRKDKEYENLLPDELAKKIKEDWDKAEAG
jgi:hypothetical protein